MSEIPKLTKGERRALAVVYAILKDSSSSAWTCTPNGIQFRTMENLHYKKMLKYERGTYGDDRWRLTPEGYEIGETLFAAPAASEQEVV